MIFLLRLTKKMSWIGKIFLLTLRKNMLGWENKKILLVNKKISYRKQKVFGTKFLFKIQK